MVPIAFKIQDFRSIADSGECTLSGERITVLAGQNEAGKTAVLQALRDFDLDIDEKPQTPDFRPEGKYDPNPEVSVKFTIEPTKIIEWFTLNNVQVPPAIKTRLLKTKEMWITRNMESNTFDIDPELKSIWPEIVHEEKTEDGESETEGDSEEKSREGESGSEKEGNPKMLSSEEFAHFLRPYWPSFVYFDTFSGTLPKEISVSELYTKKDANSITINPTASQAVLDYIILSALDLHSLIKMASQDKQLNNYLQQCNAKITGDFLNYWKQKTDADATINLKVKHLRNEKGELKLAFYIHDNVDQYPEQRSKGFLWFLSFYLRLAASAKREPSKALVLLLDEPGSYLHARAQRDVLHLFEDRISLTNFIIYTTHSPFLLPPDKLHRVRIVVKKGQRGTLTLDRLTHPELRGKDSHDTLSPIVSAIGMDIVDSLPFTKQACLVVEGITDYMYLCYWCKKFSPKLFDKIHIFPGTGAPSVPTLCSLLIGLGKDFSVLLDRDTAGERTKARIEKDLLVEKSRIIQPKNAVTIEDLIAPSDFLIIMNKMDPEHRYSIKDKPSDCIKRADVDKVLLARFTIEELTTNRLHLNSESMQKIKTLLEEIEQSLPNTR